MLTLRSSSAQLELHRQPEDPEPVPAPASATRASSAGAADYALALDDRAARATAGRRRTHPSLGGCRRAASGRRCGHLLSRRNANLARLNPKRATRIARKARLPVRLDGTCVALEAGCSVDCPRTRFTPRRPELTSSNTPQLGKSDSGRAEVRSRMPPGRASSQDGPEPTRAVSKAEKQPLPRSTDLAQLTSISDDAAKESNLPSRGLPGPASFEDRMGHQARAAPPVIVGAAGRAGLSVPALSWRGRARARL
jgi:hypothetical protein